jgi:aminoglycoside/choline kinase family phosphotransferase
MLDNIKDESLMFFIEKTGLQPKNLYQLPIDASKRLYFRANTSSSSYIICDSRREVDSLAAFVKLSKFLQHNGLNVPKVLAYEPIGFALLEDFGDETFTRYLAKHADKETELYEIAVETLKIIATADFRNPNEEVQFGYYDVNAMNRGLELFCEWYIGEHLQHTNWRVAMLKLVENFNTLYPQLDGLPNILVLRDFHADNLMYIPGHGKDMPIGVLDFQDAMIGYPVYDLVSLLEDARRDVSSATTRAMKEQYMPLVANDELFHNSYAIFSAQRNFRILGCFYRLLIKEGRQKYAKYIPRVKSYLNASLTHPALSCIKQWAEDYAVKL